MLFAIILMTITTTISIASSPPPPSSLPHHHRYQHCTITTTVISIALSPPTSSEFSIISWTNNSVTHINDISSTASSTLHHHHHQRPQHDRYGSWDITTAWYSSSSTLSIPALSSSILNSLLIYVVYNKDIHLITVKSINM